MKKKTGVNRRLTEVEPPEISCDLASFFFFFAHPSDYVRRYTWLLSPLSASFWLLIPAIIFALFLSPSPSPRYTYLRSVVTKQALLPPPHYGTRLHFYRENNSALSSLVDLRRIVLNAFTTGKPFFSTSLLDVSMGRDLGALKGLTTLQSALGSWCLENKNPQPRF